jgi:thiamine biosynthesis lipoprotein
MIELPPTLLLPDNDPFNQDSQIDTVLDAGSYVFRDEAILGTRMRIDLVTQNYSDAKAAAINARREVDRLNEILNGRDPGSELSILNRSRTHRASPELFAVVAAAELWRKTTAGAFSGRLGRAIALWQNARDQSPSRIELARLACAAQEAQVCLDSSTRTITRPEDVEFALDAVAKGWIVDRAFEVARSSPGVFGALVEIGGDLRCGGRAPDAKGWCVGIPDAGLPADNAPLVATVRLSNHAIATSGRGPRDRIIDGVSYSPTLSPQNGWPVEHTVSVTAAGASAAAADAIATSLLSMRKEQGIAWADRHGVAARIMTGNEVTFTRAAQPDSAAASRVRFSAVNSPRAKSSAGSKRNTRANSETGWLKDWVALLTFTAPPRQLVRDQHFRSPYMAMWITDLNNKPIRTLLLVGTHLDWQEDNYIWWSINAANVQHLAGTRSMSTSGSGIYKMLWDGTDDQFQEVPRGSYILHVETSRERGKHTHRQLTLDFSHAKPFTDQIPTTEEAGGLSISFYHP